MVAERLGYLHIDTGAMYRALTLLALEEDVRLDDGERVSELARKSGIRLERANRVLIGNRDVTTEVRDPRVTQHVSRVSSYPRVREVLVRLQRRLAEHGGVVLEGRDIGTVVLPDAELKIFLTASLGERARRRAKELAESGRAVDPDVLQEDLAERDRLDSTRAVSPLKKAPGALVLDTTDLTIEEQVEFIVKEARKIIEGKDGR